MQHKTYKIGEVARLLGLETYVLRFWETEFPQLQPLRTESGQRQYTQEHLDLLRCIHDLLHKQGMTIMGARRKLVQEGLYGNYKSDQVKENQKNPVSVNQDDISILPEIYKDLLEIKNLILAKDLP